MWRCVFGCPIGPTPGRPRKGRNSSGSTQRRRDAVFSVAASQEPRPLEAGPELSPARRKAATIQQTVYLPPAVHDQLRELAFAERVKMHSLLMEGLDLVFKSSGPEAIVRAYEDPMTPLRADHGAIV